MKRTIDITQQFKNFEGKPIMESERDGDVLKATDEALTLKKVILVYLMNAHQMGLSTDDQANLYAVGFLVGAATGSVEMEQKEYDALKRMVDKGSLKTQNGDQAIYGIVVSRQAKEMVDAAKPVEKK